MSYNVADAYEYYRTHILDPHTAKMPQYRSRRIPSEGIVPFRDWEVFAAILVDDIGSELRVGSDLTRHEVKSARLGGSFEYQYHRDSGLEKFDHDQTVEHVFVAYDDSYRSVEVYALTAQQFGVFSASWRTQLEANYRDSMRQRFRRGIAFGDVTRSGALVLRIRDGLLVHP